MYFKKYRQTGREIFHNTSLSLTNHTFSLIYFILHPLFRLGVSLSVLPTIASGCAPESLPVSGQSATPIFIFDKAESLSSQISGINGSTLDILIFEDKTMHRLDSYIRVDDFTDAITYPVSTGGNKIFFMCMNSQRNRYEWADINSYSSLGKVSCNLEKEDRDKLMMTGECRGTAGDILARMMLSPLACEIHLESISCDFSGTPYQGKEIYDTKVYLTYANATCGLLPDSQYSPIRIINPGMLYDFDIKGFKDKSIIVQDIPGQIGRTVTHPGCRLLSYPYHAEGSNGTRLVIEGKIDSGTYYWPIEIGNGQGVESNRRYTYKIHIKRKGTCDPDILVKRSDIDIDLKIKPWIEKDETSVSF